MAWPREVPGASFTDDYATVSEHEPRSHASASVVRWGSRSGRAVPAGSGGRYPWIRLHRGSMAPAPPDSSFISPFQRSHCAFGTPASHHGPIGADRRTDPRISWSEVT